VMYWYLTTLNILQNLILVENATLISGTDICVRRCVRKKKHISLDVSVIFSLSFIWIVLHNPHLYVYKCKIICGCNTPWMWMGMWQI
jgi:hypothetical protein